MINFNPSYVGERDDILNLVPVNATTILDVGCSTGKLGEQIKKKIGLAKIIGIENDEEMAKIAENKLDTVIIGDLNLINLEDYFTNDYFDCIIFADILEHLNDPWLALSNTIPFLRVGGFIVASIPNVKHYSTIQSLLFRGYWPYRDRGIHDRTHLRFFTLKNIKEMFQNAGLIIDTINRNYRIIEKPHHYNRFSKYFAIPLLREFLTFQYLITARKKGLNYK